MSGVAIIIHHLSRRYSPLAGETSLRAIAEVYGFVRRNGECCDDVVSRFEIVCQRAADHAGVMITQQQAAWMLMLALRIPTEQWIHILTPFQGRLPTNDAEFVRFLNYVKRHGHLAEAGPMSIAQGAHSSSVFMFQGMDPNYQQGFPEVQQAFPSFPQSGGGGGSWGTGSGAGRALTAMTGGGAWSLQQLYHSGGDSCQTCGTFLEASDSDTSDDDP